MDKSSKAFRFTRSHAILHLKRRLEQNALPRIQMSLIVGLTGAAGLLFSFLMLDAGVTSMALRYPLALLGAYGVFLLLLWLWLRTKAEDYADIPDLTGFTPGGSGECSPAFEGSGGHFGGGGTSGSFDMTTSVVPNDPDSASPLTDAVCAVGDADELTIPIFVVVFALGLALASLYVVYVAPLLFAELLVDGALSYALYRRIRSADSPHWLASAVRRTVLPFALTGGFVAIVGMAMAVYVPGAHSIGEVIARSAHAR